MDTSPQGELTQWRASGGGGSAGGLTLVGERLGVWGWYHRLPWLDCHLDHGIGLLGRPKEPSLALSLLGSLGRRRLAGSSSGLALGRGRVGHGAGWCWWSRAGCWGSWGLGRGLAVLQLRVCDRAVLWCSPR